MITFESGYIFDFDVDAVIITVNLVGKMGKGIALMSKLEFPENFLLYKDACDKKIIDIGKIFVTKTEKEFPKYVINFPTKKHWRNSSKYEWIEDGMKSLIEWIDNNNIKSIFIPKLGCGNGNLDWDLVKQIILKYISKYENVLEIKIQK